MRKKIWVFLGTCLLFVTVGCSGDSVQTVSKIGKASGNIMAQKASDSSFVGKWKGEISFPESNGKGDASTEFAKSLAQSFFNNITLELNADSTFLLNMMFEISGTWEKHSEGVALKPEKFMGMTMDEIKKMAEEDGQSLDMPVENLYLEALPDGSLRAKEEGKPNEGELIFRKEK
jgi:hypothetical protein